MESQPMKVNAKTTKT